MSRPVAVLLKGLLAALPLLFVVPSASHASDEAGRRPETTITHVEPSAEGLQLLVSVPEGSDVDLGGVSVTVDGTQAAADRRPADSRTSIERTAVLVIDTSNSMHGERFQAAKAAARDLPGHRARRRRGRHRHFASDVTRALEPTTDRDAAREVIDGLEPEQGHPAVRRRARGRRHGRHRRPAHPAGAVRRPRHQRHPARGRDRRGWPTTTCWSTCSPWTARARRTPSSRRSPRRATARSSPPMPRPCRRPSPARPTSCRVRCS